jgi:hypothetical protein
MSFVGPALVLRQGFADRYREGLPPGAPLREGDSLNRIRFNFHSEYRQVCWAVGCFPGAMNGVMRAIDGWHRQAVWSGRHKRIATSFIRLGGAPLCSSWRQLDTAARPASLCPSRVTSTRPARRSPSRVAPRGSAEEDQPMAATAAQAGGGGPRPGGGGRGGGGGGQTATAGRAHGGRGAAALGLGPP